MATLREVARTAGVSVATASRALSDAPYVSAANRELVTRTAAALGYRPHHAARSLTTGTSDTLGLVVPDLANPFFAAVAKGVQARARETGREVLLADTDEDVAVERAVVARLAGRVDGLVLCSPRMPAGELAELLGPLAPDGRVALVNREAPGAPSVSFELSDGVRQAIGHLRALGHRTVAYAGGPRSSWSDAERRRALDDAVVDLGSFRPTHGGGMQAADLALAAGATAVLCFNDLVALGVLARLAARGVGTLEILTGWAGVQALLTHRGVDRFGVRESVVGEIVGGDVRARGGGDEPAQPFTRSEPHLLELRGHRPGGDPHRGVLGLGVAQREIGDVGA
jgi:DNA-binding LacI/PurR family transcriptional regulator